MIAMWVRMATTVYWMLIFWIWCAWHLFPHFAIWNSCCAVCLIGFSSISIWDVGPGDCIHAAVAVWSTIPSRDSIESSKMHNWRTPVTSMFISCHIVSIVFCHVLPHVSPVLLRLACLKSAIDSILRQWLFVRLFCRSFKSALALERGTLLLVQFLLVQVELHWIITFHQLLSVRHQCSSFVMASRCWQPIRWWPSWIWCQQCWRSRGSEIRGVDPFVSIRFFMFGEGPRAARRPRISPGSLHTELHNS